MPNVLVLAHLFLVCGRILSASRSDSLDTRQSIQSTFESCWYHRTSSVHGILRAILVLYQNRLHIDSVLFCTLSSEVCPTYLSLECFVGCRPMPYLVPIQLRVLANRTHPRSTDSPHPQARFACGLSISNPASIKDSFQSMTEFLSFAI